MFESILGMDLPLPAKLVVAFVIVLALIAVSMWLLRRIGGGRLTAQTARGRQPRLAVIDAAAVDSRRRLVLIRRDNVEHLVMIGGPSDVVIEQNIVRAVPIAPPRDGSRAPGPEPAGRGAADQPAPVSLEAARPVGSSPTAPALRALPQPGEGGPRAGRPPDAARRGGEREPARAEPPAPPLRVLPGDPRQQDRHEPARADGQAQGQNAASPAVEASLADMAHKLEAALRRPGPARGTKGGNEREGPPALPEPTPPTAPEAEASNAGGRAPGQIPPPLPRAPATSEASPGRPEGKTGAARSVFDSLEEEMASLLNRPGGKEQ